MASVIRRGQRSMEITGRKRLGGPTTKLGFDKSYVTFFKCKQKGHFKRECSNQDVDESVNSFHDDYYRKEIYHRNKEQPPKINQSQIGEGSSKEKKKALVVTQEDDGFNWNKYISNEKVALVAEVRWSREERIARRRLDATYEVFKEAKDAKRWDLQRKCFLDIEGNPVTDPKTVDFAALVATIPTVAEYYSVKKHVEENVDMNKEMTAENLKKMSDKPMMAKQTEVETQTESTESSNQVKSMGKNDENDEKSENINEG
ncbi:putative transcription factor interactor and regulator CCHC(Zn) family [Helianthus annuus]|nr:putative transcription factor interactor and regulator CCHC(Zn) family [Helianthus annuus]